MTGWRELDKEARTYFLSALRFARAVALRDAEQFDELLFVIERLGAYRTKNVYTLRSYRGALLDLAKKSCLGQSLTSLQSNWHSTVEALFDLVESGRNDALHQGARARHLARHAIELALVFEDAIMSGIELNPTVRDLMVRSPVIAEDWKPLSVVRQAMLTDSFSYLPVLWNDTWMLLRDSDVALFLRMDSTDSRNCRLAMSVREAVGKGLQLRDVTPVDPTEFVKDVLTRANDKPFVVIDGEETNDGKRQPRLVGFITSFDML